MVTSYFWLTLVIFVANILVLTLAYKSNNKARFAFYFGFLASYYYLAEAFLSFFFDGLIGRETYVAVSAIVMATLLVWNAVSLISLIEMKHHPKTKKFGERSFLFILVANIFAIFITVSVYLEFAINNAPNFGIWP